MLFYQYINVFLRWEDSGCLKEMQQKQKRIDQLGQFTVRWSWAISF